MVLHIPIIVIIPIEPHIYFNVFCMKMEAHVFSRALEIEIPIGIGDSEILEHTI